MVVPVPVVVVCPVEVPVPNHNRWFREAVAMCWDGVQEASEWYKEARISCCGASEKSRVVLQASVHIPRSVDVSSESNFLSRNAFVVRMAPNVRIRDDAAVSVARVPR